mgnify:CR=1 FL=1
MEYNVSPFLTVANEDYCNKTFKFLHFKEEKMFHKNHKTSKQKQGAAGKKVYARFVKGKGELNKYDKIYTI